MVKFKICGIGTGEDLAAAMSLNPNMIGFIIDESSDRRISIYRLYNLLAHFRPLSFSKAVVVADILSEDTMIKLRNFNFHYIQLHCSPKKAQRIARRVGKIWIQALDISKMSLEQIEDNINYIVDLGADHILLDSEKSGETLDWDLIGSIVSHRDKLILAGGLTADNVKKAALASDIFTVDVCSGIEDEDVLGKNQYKMREFVKQITSLN